MGAHGDRRRHRREEVGVLLDEDEEFEQHGGGCGGGATSGVVEHELELGQDGGGGMVFEASSSVGSVSATMGPPPIMCWPPPAPSLSSQQQQLHHHNLVSDGGGGGQGPFFPMLPPLPPQPPPPPPFFADFYARRALQFAYDHSGGASSSSDPLGGFGAGLYMGHHGHGMMMPPPFGPSPFGDFGRMTAQEIMDAKALAASKSHSEAERRRRERINSHLARLRSLLPNTTKTDKASLLAEVIQHVKELKRQTSEIREEACPLPTESDELTVDASSDDDGRLLVRASLCCDDRADLLPDLIRALKALRLRALKAEITTLGGRVKNVLLVTEDDTVAPCDDDDGAAPTPMSPQHTIASIQEALRAVMERTSSSPGGGEDSGGSASGGLKRQRTTSLSAILENRSI
ncbi:transcription factor bHLH30-like [Lolium rigidum]|uniref:transcription factor bHLH30-like n=1 Tax=Lolium rigidum TaxID=89674 RepID=UPI001F5DF0ED|nr:transcription factor bHLH30-like [Lolium rigidum]